MDRVDLDAAAGKVRAWILEHPDGTPDQMTADLKGGYGEFADDMAIVLRGIMGRFQDHPEELHPAGDEALETLRNLWGDAYQVSHPEPGLWTAVSRDEEGRVLSAGAPGDLPALLRADWAREGTL